MKKQISLLLTMTLMSISLVACGKDQSEQESITRIEASNAAESKEPTERKYEDTTKEPVVAPDRNNSTESSEELDNSEPTPVLNWETSIYGIWNANDGTNLTLFNSVNGVKFSMYDVSNDRFLSGDVTTDESTYIEMKYLKPVEQDTNVVETENEENTEQSENDGVNPYDSDEELYAALEAKMEAQYETVRYIVDKMDFDAELSRAYLTVTGNGKTIELYMDITSDTPDYSSKDNALAQDMIVDDSEEAESSEKESPEQ